MRVYAPPFLLAFLLVGLGLLPTAGVAQQDERVVALEGRVGQLEIVVSRLMERIIALEGQLRAAPPAAAPPTATAPAQTGNWQNRANWRQLQRGMSMQDVTRLLGEPHTVDANPFTITWEWGEFPTGARVLFDAERRRVDGWTEPGR